MQQLTDTLAVYRITRFITKDTLAEPGREFVKRRHGEDSKMYYLVNCPWCTSIYVGATVVVLRNLIPRTWNVAATALALSAGASLIQTKVE